MRTLLAIGATLTLTATPAFAQPFYVQSVRQICQLPRPNNNGRVVGHDNGSSVRLSNGTTYFFFADTILDMNGNDGYDPNDVGPGSFVGRGTVAATTDHRAKDCFNLTDYKNDGQGTATGLFDPVDLHSGECALWPIGSVVFPDQVNGDQVYIYGSAPRPCPSATNGCADACILYTSFLAKFDPATRTAHRLAVDWPETEPPPGQAAQEIQFNYPTLVTHSDGTNWIYVVGTKKVGSTLNYYMARVPTAQVETKSAYQYKNGSGWVANDPTAATPLFPEFGGGQVSIVYNKYLKRFLMTYTCGFATKICARTALVAGKDESAISGGWSDEVQIYDCPKSDGLGCYAAFQHGEFAKRAIYVTTARLSPLAKRCSSNADCRCSGSPDYLCHMPPGQTTGTCDVPINLQKRYALTLHEIVLAKTPPLTPIQRFESAKSYSPATYCSDPQMVTADGWSNKQLDSRGIFGDLNFSYVSNWTGTESLNGVSVPQIDQDTTVPGASLAAVRLWKAPTGTHGLIRISGEARKKFSCGGPLRVEAIRIAAVTDKVSSLWFADLKPSARTARYNFTTTLNSGDSIGFKTSGGADPACDRVVFSPLIQK